MIKVLLADDYAIVREGIKKLIDEEPGIKVVGEASDGREAVSLAGKLKPSLAILDVAMPVLNGLEATRQIRQRNQEIKVILLTQFDYEDYLFTGFRAGATGYVLKSATSSELIWAIKTVLKGFVYLSPSMTEALIKDRIVHNGAVPASLKALTPREHEIFKLLAKGLSCQEIADQVVISLKTVHTHRSRIMEKLNLNTPAELVKYAIQKGIISL